MEKLDITLDNFQSISSAELSFEQGINIIVGQSNSGKSAILRAIKAVLLNPNGSARYIKKGTDQSTVTLNYIDKLIEWDRKKKETKYTINGEPLTKTGNSNAFKLTNDDTGFTLDTQGNLMNIEGELELPFPFDRSPAELFKLFENVFCVSDSATILKAFKEEEDNIQKQINETNNSIKSIRSKLDGLQALKGEVNLEQLRLYKTKLLSLNEQQTTLRETFDEVTQTINILKRIKLNDKYNEFDLTDKGVVEYKELQQIYNSTKVTMSLITLAKSFKTDISFDNTIIQEYKDLLEDYNELKHASKFANLLDGDIQATPPLDINLFSEYNELCKDYKSAKSDLQQLKNLSEKKKQLEEEQKEIKSRLEEFKVCPLCGHTLGE